MMERIACLLLVIAFTFGEKNHIPVVTSIDDGYVHPVMVMLTSLFENAYPNTTYQVYIFVPGHFKRESKMQIDSLEKKYENNKVSIIDMDKRFSGKNKAVYLYYRLQAASILADQKKCIYLDGDVIVRRDLSEMYDTNMDDYYVAGVRDIYSLHHEECEELGIDVSHYICAGVMIMNLESIRNRGLEEIFLKTLEEKKEMIDKHKNDQSVINLVCQGKVLCLPNEFGLMINYREFFPGDWEKKNPTIIHFCGTKKPWKYPELTMFHREFWIYAAKTGVYDEEIDMLKDGRKVLNERGRIVSKEKARGEKKKIKKKKDL